MPNLFKLPTWSGAEVVHVVVETPRGGRATLSYDPELRTFVLEVLAGPVVSLGLGFYSFDAS
jgi:hypothetical protein